MKSAWWRWKDFVDNVRAGKILNAKNAERLAAILANVPRRRVKDAYDRIIGDGNKLAGVVRRLLLQAQKKPKEAFDKWAKYVDDVNKKKLLDQVNA